MLLKKNKVGIEMLGIKDIGYFFFYAPAVEEETSAWLRMLLQTSGGVRRLMTRLTHMFRSILCGPMTTLFSI